jgi:hypothetical protein
MRKWHAFWFLLVAPTVGLLAAAARAQDPGQEILYSKYRQFRIPFKTDPGVARLRQLQLFVSTDQGRSWQPNAIVTPDQSQFSFLCDRDGTYWFTVQTLDQEGRRLPATVEGAQPSLKVVVDTQPPVVQLRPLAGRGAEVGVTWDIQDDHLDLKQADILRLEYRPAGGVGWITLPANPAATQHYWDPQTNAPLEVRLRVRDRAGNIGEGTTNVIVGQHDSGPPPPPAAGGHAGGQPAGFPADVERRLVNSRRISLNYELKEVGPSGVSTVELWFTQDGRSWNRYPLPKVDEAGGPPRPLVFEVAGEGVYGFTLVAKSGVGLGDRPPQLGDRPQIVVEVDLTRPVVQLHSIVVGQGSDKGKLTVTWTARDKNLGREPISISYGKKADGPWTPIVTHLDNAGRYVWQMPEDVPYQFFMRVEAVDRAGNVGAAITADMVKVDLSQPKVKILTVEPAGR